MSNKNETDFIKKWKEKEWGKNDNIKNPWKDPFKIPPYKPFGDNLWEKSTPWDSPFTPKNPTFKPNPNHNPNPKNLEDLLEKFNTTSKVCLKMEEVTQDDLSTLKSLCKEAGNKLKEVIEKISKNGGEGSIRLKEGVIILKRVTLNFKEEKVIEICVKEKAGDRDLGKFSKEILLEIYKLSMKELRNGISRFPTI